MRGKGEAVMKKARKVLKITLIMVTVVTVMSGMCMTSYANEKSYESPYNIYLESYGYNTRLGTEYTKKGEADSVSDGIVTFELINKDVPTANAENAYCCDIITSAIPGSYYKRINLEDSYLKDKEGYIVGKLITLFKYCYWEWDDGDLEKAANAVNKWAKTTKLYKSKKIEEKLTKQQAINASQTVIWRIVNNDDIDYVKGYDEKGTYYKPTDTDKNNIELFCAYLEAQVADVNSNEVPDDNRTMIFTDNCFTSDETIVTDMGGSNDVALKFKLKGTVTANDELTLVATMGTQEKTMNLGKNGEAPDDKGYYYIEFENVPDNAVAINLSIEGQQILNKGVYFYEAMPVDGATARSASQNLISCVSGDLAISPENNHYVTNVHADKTIKIKDIDDSSNSTGEVTGGLADGNGDGNGNVNADKDGISTGDDMHILPFALIMVTAAGVAAVALAGRKREYKNRQ